MKKLSFLLLCAVLTFAMVCPALAAESDAELTAAAAHLKEQGIMVGNQDGDMDLDSGLTRAQLATILTRLNGDREHIQADQTFYISQCKFTDVPVWAKLYVGYCYFNSLMVGYDTGVFGADDGVTPAAACTVVLRYLDRPDIQWDYSTACQTAVDQGLTTAEAISKTEITRGDLAVMLYRALGNTDFDNTVAAGEPSGSVSRNPDGSINLPTDGTQYVPQVGDVIRCNDGTNYSITDVRRWDKSMFASGPVGELPEPTCDWSLMPQPDLPTPEARHYSSNGHEYLFVRNLYETRRMLYTLYNAIGNNSQTWQNGAPVPHPSGAPKVQIYLSIDDGLNPRVFWPWRADQIVDLFNSCPPGTYRMEAWDVYKDGVFQRTEYNIHVR